MLHSSNELSCLGTSMVMMDEKLEALSGEALNGWQKISQGKTTAQS